MNFVFTIGYEGTDIDRFVSSLRAVGIKTVADVRAVALSRKKGFSKTALRNRLESEGIRYVHFIKLGDPKPGREAARAGRFNEFRHIYNSHLNTAEAQKSLDALRTICSTSDTCLLCFERDPQTCHRTIIADRLCTNNRTKFELYGDLPRRYDNFSSKYQGRNVSESASAA
jgi:uncharacterized protein (DUF488 family)